MTTRAIDRDRRVTDLVLKLAVCCLKAADSGTKLGLRLTDAGHIDATGHALLLGPSRPGVRRGGRRDPKTINAGCAIVHGEYGSTILLIRCGMLRAPR